MEDWKKSLANYSSKVIGKTLVLLNGDTTECRFRECNLGNLICDAMVGLKVKGRCFTLMMCERETFMVQVQTW